MILGNLELSCSNKRRFCSNLENVIFSSFSYGNVFAETNCFSGLFSFFFLTKKRMRIFQKGDSIKWLYLEGF